MDLTIFDIYNIFLFSCLSLKMLFNEGRFIGKCFGNEILKISIQ